MIYRCMYTNSETIIKRSDEAVNRDKCLGPG